VPIIRSRLSFLRVHVTASIRRLRGWVQGRNVAILVTHSVYRALRGMPMQKPPLAGMVWTLLPRQVIRGVRPLGLRMTP